MKKSQLNVPEKDLFTTQCGGASACFDKGSLSISWNLSGDTTIETSNDDAIAELYAVLKNIYEK